VKELTLSPDGTVAEDDEDEDDDDEDPWAAGADEDDVDEFDEQAAAIRAAAPTTATQPARARGLFLLPSSIPYTFRRAMCADTPTRDTAEHVCPYATDGRCYGDHTSSSQSRKKLLMNGTGPKLFVLRDRPEAVSLPVASRVPST
jgi:hypothetical protein